MTLSPLKTKGRMERLTFIIIAVLSASLLLVSMLLIRRSASTYAQAKKNTEYTLVMNDLLSGCLDLMFVRGRLNVVLSRQESITDSDRLFLAERFSKANALITIGISSLHALYPKLAIKLRTRYTELVNLKDVAIIEAGKNMSERDPTIKNKWFSTANSFIENTGDEMLYLSLKNMQEGYAFNYQRLLVLTVAYRNYYGSKASLVTSLMELNKRATIEDLMPILIIDGRLVEAWLYIELYAQSTENERLNETIKNVKEQCFGTYYENLIASQKALILGQPLPIDPKILIAQSVVVLDAINSLLETVFFEAMRHSRSTARNSLQGFAMGLLVLLWSILAVILAPIFLRRKVFGPIDAVMHKLKDACNISADRYTADNELLVLSKTADLLISKVAEAQKSNREIRRIADRDALTGLINRRAFLEIVSNLVTEATNSNKFWAVATFDLDHFKQVNDTYGHAAGDAALQHFAIILADGMRSNDLACRYGGEEFMIFLNDANEETSFTIVERIRKELEKSIITYQGQIIILKVSAGIYATSEKTSLTDAIRNSDQALYKAKESGRNRSEMWKPEE